MMNCAMCILSVDLEERWPKLLFCCGHTVCQACLNTITPCLQCPQCKQVWPAGTEIPDNHVIIEHLKSKMSLTMWCLTCNKLAEADCFKEHKLYSTNKMLSDSFKSLQIEE